MNTFQQGDTLWRKIPALPKHMKKRPTTVVAEGEATGHKHEVIGDGVEVYEDERGTLYVSAPNGGRVQHEEHHAIELPPGNYTVGIVQEYDHFAEEARRVAD